jgi:hypothetical protein
LVVCEERAGGDEVGWWERAERREAEGARYLQCVVREQHVDGDKQAVVQRRGVHQSVVRGVGIWLSVLVQVGLCQERAVVSGLEGGGVNRNRGVPQGCRWHGHGAG